MPIKFYRQYPYCSRTKRFLKIVSNFGISVVVTIKTVFLVSQLRLHTIR